MSEQQAQPDETLTPAGGVDLKEAQTVGQDKGAGEGTTVSREEFQKLQEQLQTVLKESTGKDKTISELKKETEAKKAESLSLKGLQDQLAQQQAESTRFKFALKNNVSDDLLPYLAGATEEELTTNWQALSALIDKKAEEKHLAELKKLGTGVFSATPSKGGTEEDAMVKAILEAK